MPLNTAEYHAFEAHWKNYAMETVGEEPERFVAEFRPRNERKKTKKTLDINMYGEPVITEEDIPKESTSETLDEVKAKVSPEDILTRVSTLTGVWWTNQ